MPITSAVNLSAHDLRKKWGVVYDDVIARGAIVRITRHDRPIAVLVRADEFDRLCAAAGEAIPAAVPFAERT